MGTNYYTPPEPPCEHCGRGGEELHVGKSSVGWKFVFAPYPERGLTSWKAWRDFLADKPLRDEYGKAHSLEDFVALVEAKQREPRNLIAREDERDADGYAFARSWDFS